MAWTAFLLGLAGSLHCAGMCGPLAVALPHHGRGMGGFVAGRLLYQLGRIATYAAFGAVFGFAGRSLALAGIQRWVSIAAGALVLGGLLVARPAAASGAIAGWVAWIKARLGGLLRRRSQSTLFLLGAVNGLLPCGLVYVACAGAAAGGSVAGGVAQMAWFGLGTTPLMAAIALSGRAMPFAWRLRLQRLIPATVALAGVLLVLRGLDLGIPYVSPHIGPDGRCH